MAKKPRAAGGTSLVIVESPAKARTISKFLGRAYTIEASIGHIRDLPQGAKEIPEQYKKEDWAYLGVDVNHDFEPVYVIPHAKSQQVRKLKGLLKDAKELYLATDEDREGEAISWHLCEVLQPKVPVHRLVFHEITEEAIRDALENPRQIDEQPGPCPGGPPHRRPPVRLRRFPAAVAEDSAAAVGRPGAERRRAADRRARTAADGLRVGHVLGLAGHVRQAGGQPFQAELISLGRPAHPRRPRLRSGHGPAEGPEAAAVGRASGGRTARSAARGPVPRGQSRRQAVHHPALSAVYHQHAATRGEPQIRLYRPAHHAGGPKPVRKRPHHLHANRFDHAGFGGDRGRPATGRFAIREGVSAGRAARLSDQGQECPGGPRGDSAGRAPRSISPSRSADGSAPTSSSSTTWSGNARSPAR